MRNLKRALSLAMASIMLLGMMVVGASAKGLDDFGDAAEIVNQDAVAVTSAIGIFDGYEDGEFKPENVVTRAEMAVIICKMLYGADVKVAQFAETKVFTDVPAWAEGYVNLCASLGIVAGVGDNKYDPNSTVTTAEAAMMLTKTLGYFQNAKDFGSNWKVAATAKATSLGLYGDLNLSADAGLTRDSVAEMVFNTLTKAVPVQYNELLGVYYNENKGILYSLTYYYTDTLGYKNFDLVYKTNENTDYGRPGTTWGTGSYALTGTTTGEGNKDGQLNEDGSLIPNRVKMNSEDEIITIADTPFAVYTSGTKENVIYKAVGKSVVEDYEWVAYIDGDEQADPAVPANDKDTTYTYTKKGAQTEVYVDNINEKVTVVEINYYLAQVTKVKTDDDGEYATVKMETTNAYTRTIDDRNIYCEGFEVDDYVVVTVDVDEDGDSFIASIADPATAEGTVTRVSKDSDPEGNQGSYVRLDDNTKYTYSVYTASDLDDVNDEHPTLDIAYRLYLDPNGYVLGFIALDDYYDNYLYVTDAAMYLGTIEAKVVFSDGTSKTVTIDNELTRVAADNNSSETIKLKSVYVTETAIQTYLKDKAFAWTEDDGVYTLREINQMGNVIDKDLSNYWRYKDAQSDVSDTTAEIKNDAAYITVGGTAYIVDEDTAFVDVDEKVLYTGFENVPDYVNGVGLEAVKFVMIDSNDNGVLDVVFIYSGEPSNTNETFFFVADTGAFETYNKNKTYKEHDLYIDGDATTLVFNQAAHNDINVPGLYRVDKTNGSGVVTEITYIGAGKTAVGGLYVPVAVGSRSFSLMINNKAQQFVTDGDTIIVVATYDLKTNKVDYKDASVTTGSLKDMKEEEGYDTYAVVVDDSNSGKTADLVYIVKYEISSATPSTPVSSAYVLESDSRYIDVKNSSVIVKDSDTEIADLYNALTVVEAANGNLTGITVTVEYKATNTWRALSSTSTRLVDSYEQLRVVFTDPDTSKTVTYTVTVE